MNQTKKKYRIDEPPKIFNSLNFSDIIQKCKETIEITKLEGAQCQKMFLIVKDKMNCIIDKEKKIYKETRELKNENDQLQYYLSEKKKVLKSLQNLRNIIDKDLNTSIRIDISNNPDLRIFQTYTQQKQQIGEDLLIKIEEDTNIVKELQIMLNKLQDDTELLRESGAFWNCIRCCQTFKEGYNEETCKYHSGKLKYFSCRTCGGDEYFTCCNQCRDCNSGCTIGLHKP